MKKRWSILILAAFLGFGLFLKSRWNKVAALEAANHRLESRIASKWRQAVVRREAASSAIAARMERFHLRKLAAIFIDARVSDRPPDPEVMQRQSQKLARLSVDELAEVVDELQASSLPDDARTKIEAMLSTAMLARCVGDPDHDALIHRFLMNTPAPPGPDITRPLIALISDTRLRNEVARHLATPAPP